MSPDDEAVFEVKAPVQVEKKQPQAVAPDDDVADLDILEKQELPDDEFDEAKPKTSIIQAITGAFKKPKVDDPDLDDTPVPEKDELLDEEFPKQSFLQNLFGGFGKKSVDDDDDLGDLKIPKQ
ncbi:MAG: hypothetical protein JW768_04220 [Chitinispirillaceae bacterium]|nr:hypothetical protein [Chitinispirillaceae bacterium]